jgi:hypothetical protein
MEIDQRPRGMLTNDQFDILKTAMEAYRETTMTLMTGVKTDLLEQGLTTEDAEIYKGWDVHCFFPRVNDPNKIIHLQLCIRVPAQPTINIRIREMDQEKIKTAREMSSVGSEETAVTKYILPDEKHRKKHDKYPVLFSQAAISIALEQALK